MPGFCQGGGILRKPGMEHVWRKIERLIQRIECQVASCDAVIAKQDFFQQHTGTGA
jgi:hypothetical protein